MRSINILADGLPALSADTQPNQVALIDDIISSLVALRGVLSPSESDEPIEPDTDDEVIEPEAEPDTDTDTEPDDKEEDE